MENSRQFIKLETLGAHLLLGATLLALVISNSPWRVFYENMLHSPISIQFTQFTFKTDVLFLINEGLMSIFFLVVGLEIKYELFQGALNTLPKALLPGFAAIGGMLVPAAIYIGFNHHDSTNLRGWAIPTATDIAFSLGVLSLLGRRVSVQLKTFLTALAIFDDLAAILVIAVFYTAQLSLLSLGLSVICLLAIYFLNIKAINSILLYCAMGLLLWICLFNSGINPTLSGVALAFLMPMNCTDPHRQSASTLLKELLHPGVALGILPIFAFANAGISFMSLSLSSLHLSITLGILTSLFIGKQLGVFGTCWLAVKFRLAQLPEQVQWIDLYGISIICGIGFTISLFIGSLAFSQESIEYMNSIKVGVLSGSLLSGVVGYLLLSLSKRWRKHRPSP